MASQAEMDEAVRAVTLLTGQMNNLRARTDAAEVAFGQSNARAVQLHAEVQRQHALIVQLENAAAQGAQYAQGQGYQAKTHEHKFFNPKTMQPRMFAGTTKDRETFGAWARSVRNYLNASCRGIRDVMSEI